MIGTICVQTSDSLSRSYLNHLVRHFIAVTEFVTSFEFTLSDIWVLFSKIC
jgi:hypothetical protein